MHAKRIVRTALLLLLLVAAGGVGAVLLSACGREAASPRADDENADVPCASMHSDARAATDFNRGAAAQALMSVDVKGCGTATSPWEPGHLRVTFAPSGEVTCVAVDGDLRLTPEARCLANRFRQVRVPPFHGGDVTVGRAFVLR